MYNVKIFAEKKMAARLESERLWINSGKNGFQSFEPWIDQE